MSRTKAWVKTLLQHGAAIEQAIGFRLGPLLGCGHWGCVLDLPDSPWVLKLTVDPTEAFVWRRIIDLIAEEGYGQGGFPRVAHIYELKPGIEYGKQGRKKKAYAIVREKAAPVFSSTLWTTPYTMARIQLPEPAEAWTMLQHIMTEDLHDFNWSIAETQLTLRGLSEYPGRRQNSRASTRRQRQFDRLERAINKMNGAIGGPVGELFHVLLSNNMVLLDVHYGNIGWREIEQIGPDYQNPGLVIFHPGHTPTRKTPLKSTIEWKENPLGGGGDVVWLPNPMEWRMAAKRNPEELSENTPIITTHFHLA